jgi:mono/diheme cytochrome c family protein
MRRKVVWIGTVVLCLGLVTAFLTRGMGFTSRAAPSALESRVMRGARHWGTPSTARQRPNPVPPTDDVVHDAMAHWADHCATCHANDGSGHTPIGRSVYPPAPDMRVAQTQDLTDGELFYIIERGVPFTAMPGWSNGTDDGARQSWALVHFIRRLPRLGDTDIAEMEKLNPKSAAQSEQEKRINDFLKGKNDH